MRSRWLLALCGLVIATPCLAQAVKTGKDTDGKDYLETAAGMTLYVFDRDGPRGGGSSCHDECARLWPPFAADPNAKPHGDWTLVKRLDGSWQWAYKGRPLYTFSKDNAPGQENGNGYNGNTWHIAQT